jgi:16S rRNA (cytidine1402-2'-O)-methyltransferase
MTAIQPACLWVVATPIGHRDDLSARAIETLRAVAVIAAEDTRHSRPLLLHHNVDTPLVALHEHNEREVVDAMVRRLQGGESVALISDAGTPLISDPGFRLVRAARAAGIRCIPVPGACAAIAALSVAGIPSDRFCFEGFLPAKGAARRERLAGLAREPRTLVFYESSHRIEESLADMADIFGPEREAILARELTKLYETVLGDSLGAILARVRADDQQRRGEFVLVVRGAIDDGTAALREGQRLYARLKELLSPSQAAKLAAELSGAPRKSLYGGEA